jgi:proton-coupled amino acid transporter
MQVLMTVGLAAAIPQLGLVISLVGSLGSGALALILPPLLSIRALRRGFSLKLCVDGFIVAFGTLGSIVGTYVAVKEIVDAFTSSSD